MEVTKILLGITLFSLLSIIYARIGIWAIVISSLIYCVKSMTKILFGVPLFSLLFLVYIRIRIFTIEVKANTQQVLAAPAQTGKPLRLHRPSRVTSYPTDWVPYRMVDPWIKVSR